MYIRTRSGHAPAPSFFPPFPSLSLTITTIGTRRQPAYGLPYNTLLFFLIIYIIFFNSMRLISINHFKALHILFFVIASAGLINLLIYFISVISRRSYNWRRYIKSIIKRFSCVISSLIKQSKKNLELIQHKRICACSVPSKTRANESSCSSSENESDR